MKIYIVHTDAIPEDSKYFGDLTDNINKQMHDTLAEFINEHGGIIRTENPDNDTMYAIVYDEELEMYKEYKVLAVATFDGGKSVGVIGHFVGDTPITFEKMSDEEVLEEDGWYTLYGGMMMWNATLYCLCECIEEYVK